MSPLVKIAGQPASRHDRQATQKRRTPAEVQLPQLTPVLPPCQRPLRVASTAAPSPLLTPERLLVVVEGMNDMRAVRRAVPSDVYVLGSTTWSTSQRVSQDLRGAAADYAGLVILTDPDVAGRQARLALDEQLPGCYHAFVPAPLATAAVATMYHEEGNVGIEHAAPHTIRHSLSLMRRSDAHRTEFTREMLLELELVAPMNQKGGNITERRELVCSFLGIGMSDGKQLLRQLNRYHFTAQDLRDALAWAEAQLTCKRVSK